MASLKPYLFIILTLCSSIALAHINHHKITYDSRALMVDGKKKLIFSGSIHYPRSTPEMWPSLIKKAKEGGLDAIETYVFWNAHERLPRQYDFSGNLDLIKFLRIVQEEKMYAILRIGPYICAEWNYGGLPVWLHNMGNVSTFRTNDEAFENEMRIFTTLIVEKVQKAGLFASQGGPIILAQIENEYGDISRKLQNYGATDYINWCANLAESYGTGVPWIMCQEKDAPSPMIETCNGFYCDQFYPQNKNVPKVWTENWVGWFKKWGGQDEHRPAEDVAFSVARFFQMGGTVHNYYMYHGGTNFGRTAGGPYIITSYDYDAPLNEYGMVNQPKYGHLKQLHVILKAREEILTEGVPRNVDYTNLVAVTEYTLNNKSLCFLSNANDNEDVTVDYKGVNYTIPAWSVSIRDDCKTEVYSTARVNVQTSVLEKKPANIQSPKLKWKWGYEFIEEFVYPGRKFIYYNELREQKSVTNDVSDYLWYMTSVEDPDLRPSYTLQVNTGGHVLHAFVNRVYIGSQFSDSGEGFVFERTITLKPGKNKISLLSATIGLPNYGAEYEKGNQGVIGPVKLIAPNKEIDLSNKTWAYKVGLTGEQKKFYRKDDPMFKADKLPSNRMLTWYKTNFDAPPGDDPVVLDLLGMGKGMAWVNGHNIGRYWPSKSDVSSCVEDCDFHGGYRPERKCRKCNQPSQRFYHVPRSFFKPGKKNSLVLFEEIGGNVKGVNFQTVSTWKACGQADEGHDLELSCDGGRQIKQIRFASYGSPKGQCGDFQEGFCGANNALEVVSKACIGKETCSIQVLDKNFEASHCDQDVTRRLAVEAVCR